MDGRAAAIVLAWTALTACGTGGSESQAPEAGPPPSLEQACSDLYGALEAWAPCSYVSAGSRSRYLAFCESRFGAHGVPPSTLSAAETCVATLKGAASTCAQLPADACKVPAGTLAAGAACGTALQCASGYCAAAGGTQAERLGDFTDLGANELYACGTCIDMVPIGGACKATYQCTLGCWSLLTPCAGDAMCTGQPGSGQSGTCAALFMPDGGSTSGGVGAGGACGSNLCAEGLLCSNGTCTPGKKLGEPCAVSDGGMNDCFGFARCDPTTKVCTAPSFPAPGAPCGSTSYVCQTGSCALSADGGGTCPPVLAEGQPCMAGASPPQGVCDDYAVCVTPQQVAGCCSAGSPSGSGSGSGPPPTNEATCVFFDPRTCK